MPLLIPQAIGWTLGVVGAALAGRALAKHLRGLEQALRPHQAGHEMTASGRVRALRLDPQTGIYRPE